jgi:hypothetical protein
MPITQEQMARSQFNEAAFNPSKRPVLVQRMLADPVLQKHARAELQRLKDGQAGPGMLLDRCAISRQTHDMLVAALRQVDAAQPPVTIEDK